MISSLLAKIVFGKLLSRPDISKAYKMVGPEDSWYNTIKTVHDSLAKIQQLPHSIETVTSKEGYKLSAIYYPADCTSDKTVICIHGFGSHAEREWAFPGLFYHSLGFNVLIPYQRAHGPSEGDRITFGVLESDDMLGWIGKVNELTPNGKILLHGLSMGGGIGLCMSSLDMTGVRCIIADAPSQGLDYFYTRVSKDIFGPLGKSVGKAAISDFRKKTGIDPSEYNINRTIPSCKYPILLSAGSMEGLDEYFSQLSDKNPADTEIIILPGCNHGNGMYKQTELYQGRIKDFISKYM